MSDYNTDGFSDGEWQDRGDLVWNEFDWERYLRDQDENILRYLACYEKLRKHPQRLDEAARLMGWDMEEWNGETDKVAVSASGDAAGDDSGAGPDPAASGEPDGESGGEADSDDMIPGMDDDDEPYTLHKNPVFIATRAIYLSLSRSWARLAGDPANVPQGLAVSHLHALQAGEMQSLLAMQALDFGDYALAISFFKRALHELNATMASLGKVKADASRLLRGYCAGAMPRLFDLREIWLRVMAGCRHELSHPSEDDDFEDEE
ncbi:hypothetical protein OpiT1DRAFT_01803 [Opitutaceae bacterium TAV1]|nr:hypothetical protein OpiT1DRAFT_01803 [Opitutaceae bacterium TAV1]